MDDIEITYNDFFKKFKHFKKEQNKQKQRGLNNYNILTTVLKKTDEVRLHSRMIYSFLNPRGEHYQGSLFLGKFIRVLDINDLKINLDDCTVYKEYKNIDLYITDGSKHIIIENKVYASDQRHQIKRYIEIIQEENENIHENDILVVYLSLNRDQPSKDSLGEMIINGNVIEKEGSKIAQFKSIHYKNEILKWLDFCQFEIQNITNLNEVFKQYIDVVKMLNNQHRREFMTLSTFITKDTYEIADEIHKNFNSVRKEIINSFFENVKQALINNLGEGWVVEIKGDLAKKDNFPLRIFKTAWQANRDDKLIFGFEFENNNYHDGLFGIVRENENINIQNSVLEVFKNDISTLEFENKLSIDTSDVWWLHWEHCPNFDEADDLPKFIIIYDEAENDFTSEILKMIRIFELDTGLITKINKYLAKKRL